MEIQITKQTKIKEVSVAEFNVAEINKIKKLKGGAARQKSKAPTFSSHLWGHIPRINEQLGMVKRSRPSH